MYICFHCGVPYEVVINQADNQHVSIFSRSLNISRCKYMHMFVTLLIICDEQE